LSTTGGRRISGLRGSADCHQWHQTRKEEYFHGRIEMNMLIVLSSLEGRRKFSVNPAAAGGRMHGAEIR
jgi:hypothetical protein